MDVCKVSGSEMSNCICKAFAERNLDAIYTCLAFNEYGRSDKLRELRLCDLVPYKGTQ